MNLLPMHVRPSTAFQWPQNATAGELTFEPLYKIYDKRYMVYFDQTQWFFGRFTRGILHANASLL